jgi:tRNA(Ile)-lysidine synthase
VLVRLQQEVINAKDDRQPQLPLEKGVLTRYRQRLYWVPSAAFAPPPQACFWHLDQPLNFGPLQLDVSDASSREIGFLSSCAPKGVAGSMRKVVPITGHLHLPATLTQLQVRFAQGGERILRNGQHQQISEGWRAAGIPPWQRRWLPLFYLDEELVAAAALGVADYWRTETGSATTIMAWRLQPDLTGY